MDKIEVILGEAGRIVRTLNLQELTESFSNMVKKMTSADYCRILLIGKENDKLYTFSSQDGIEEPIQITELHKDVIITAKQIIKENVKIFINQEEHIVKTLLLMPIFDSSNKIIALLEASNKEFDFGENEQWLISRIGEFAGLAIESKLHCRQIFENQKKALLKLAKIMEYKSGETSNHQLRVSLLADLIAKELNIPEDQREILKIAALFREIGKIGIPDSIINKTGELDPEEWEIMKRHPIIGYEILYDEENEILKMAAIIALEHHERWDGRGYPFGKKEEEISLWGRIVSLIDNFESLTSERVFRDAWSIEETIQYIIAMKGKAFDPNLVDIFMKNIDKVIEIKKKYPD